MKHVRIQGKTRQPLQTHPFLDASHGKFLTGPMSWEAIATPDGAGAATLGVTLCAFLTGDPKVALNHMDC